MLTNNWYNVFKMGFGMPECDSLYRDTSGNYRRSSARDLNQVWPKIFMPSVAPRTDYGAGVVFGSGTTPPTVDDYSLESILSGISFTYTVEVSADGTTRTAVYTIVNNNSTDITISEYGHTETTYMWRGATNDSNNSYSGALLLSRSLLDEPITIPALEAGSVTIIEKLSIPGV